MRDKKKFVDAAQLIFFVYFILSTIYYLSVEMNFAKTQSDSEFVRGDLYFIYRVVFHGMTGIFGQHSYVDGM